MLWEKWLLLPYWKHWEPERQVECFSLCSLPLFHIYSFLNALLLTPVECPTLQLDEPKGRPSMLCVGALVISSWECGHVDAIQEATGWFWVKTIMGICTHVWCGHVTLPDASGEMVRVWAWHRGVSVPVYGWDAGCACTCIWLMVLCVCPWCVGCVYQVLSPWLTG